MTPTPGVAPLKLALIPEHLERRVPGHQHEESKIEYVESGPGTEQRKGLTKGGKIAIGVMVPLVVVGLALRAWAARRHLNFRRRYPSRHENISLFSGNCFAA